MNKALAMILFTIFGTMFYIGWVIDTYAPVTSNVTQGMLPKKATTSDYELPELNEEEQAQTDSLLKSYVKESEEESQTKSVEKLRDEVYKILDEIVEEDSTISISFNMQIKSPWINETEEN